MGFDEFARAFLNYDSLVVAAPLLMQGALVSLLLIVSIVPAALALGILVAVAYDLGGPLRRRATFKVVLKGSRIGCNTSVRLREVCNGINRITALNKELLHLIRDPL